MVARRDAALPADGARRTCRRPGDPLHDRAGRWRADADRRGARLGCAILACEAGPHRAGTREPRDRGRAEGRDGRRRRVGRRARAHVQSRQQGRRRPHRGRARERAGVVAAPSGRTAHGARGDRGDLGERAPDPRDQGRGAAGMVGRRRAPGVVPAQREEEVRPVLPRGSRKGRTGGDGANGYWNQREGGHEGRPNRRSNRRSGRPRRGRSPGVYRARASDVTTSHWKRTKRNSSLSRIRSWSLCAPKPLGPSSMSVAGPMP